MKKLGLFLLGLVAFFVLLGNIGPLFGLAVSAVVSYYAVKGFLKTNSTGTKILWAIIGFFAISITIANVPAILAILAAYILYVVYKKLNNDKEEEVSTEMSNNDPFTNFENQWKALNSK